MVTAVLRGQPQVTGRDERVIGVLPQGVQVRSVSVTPPTRYMPAQFTFSVTNTGEAADVFDITLEGPLAAGARLETPIVSLLPGVSRVLRVDAAPRGSLDAVLALRARSRTAHDVHDVAVASTDPPTDVSARFEPGAVILATPGESVFLLEVTNTSSTTESYSIRISGTENVSAARWEATPPGAVSVVRVTVPPGSTAGLPLVATMQASGAASVSVRVTSERDPDVTADAIALMRTPEPVVVDDDQDGLPDSFEACVGLDGTSSAGEAGASGDPDGDGRTNLQELDDGTNPRGFVTRYFAEGATGEFFRSRIALANPSSELAAHVWLRFLPLDGKWVTHCITVPALGRRTVDVGTIDGLSASEFATAIESDVPVIAERTMTWDGTGYGAHTETSVDSAATEWFLAEGATIGQFQLFYLLQNATFEAADVEVTYLLPAPQAPIVKLYRVEPGSRFNIWVNHEDEALGSAEVSARIRSVNGVPIIVERAMYLNGRRTFEAGHESAGITRPGPGGSWLRAPPAASSTCLY